MNEIVNIDEDMIQNRIFMIRGFQVILDKDLAKLYGVETKVFNQSVKRNIERFPEKFRFQLTEDEYANLRSQIVTSNLDTGHGGRRYFPYVFTEQNLTVKRPETGISPMRWDEVVGKIASRDYQVDSLIEG